MVFHFQLENVRQKTQTYPRLLRSGVPCHIVERFLQHTINMHSRRAVDWERWALLLIGYGNSGLPFYGGNVPVERAFQPGLVQHYRMKRLGKTANALERSLHDLKNLLQISTQ